VIYRYQNYRKIPIADGDELIDMQFAQAEPHTVIPELVGKRIAIVRGGLRNVDPDPAWTLIDCKPYHVRTVEITKKIELDGGVIEIVDREEQVVA